MKDGTYISPYSIWRDTLSDPCVDKKDLVSAIACIGVYFCSTLIDSLQRRLEPYMSLFWGSGTYWSNCTKYILE